MAPREKRKSLQRAADPKYAGGSQAPDGSWWARSPTSSPTASSRGRRARVSAEIGWSKAFVERLKKGEYRTLGDPAWIPGALGAPPAKSDPRKRVKPQRTKRTSQKRR